MLLEVARPAIAVELSRVGAAVQSLLDVAADAHCPAGVDEVLDAADWRYQRPLWLRSALEHVVALESADRVALAQAYRHDIAFADSYDDDGFAFRFATLSPAARAAGKLLLHDLYEKIFAGKHGFVCSGAPLVQRRAFEQGFRERNRKLRVCPACAMLPLSKPARSSSLVDIDHVLPRSRYPHLTVHPDNLLPICKLCNKAKLDRDPLEDGGSPLPLTACYLPYARSALGELTISFQVTRPGEYGVRLDGTTSAAARRVRTLDRLLALSERWSDSLDAAHIALMTAISMQCGPRADERRVHAQLLARAAEARRLVVVVPGKLIEAAWANWLAHEGLATVMDELGRPGWGATGC